MENTDFKLMKCEGLEGIVDFKNLVLPKEQSQDYLKTVVDKLYPNYSNFQFYELKNNLWKKKEEEIILRVLSSEESKFEFVKSDHTHLLIPDSDSNLTFFSFYSLAKKKDSFAMFLSYMEKSTYEMYVPSS